MFSFGPINPKNFLLGEIPVISPFSPKRVLYWKDLMKKCIEGYWYSGRWMPGKLFFYSNLATIRLNKDGAKLKTLGRPNLRDIEWLTFYAWEEARGFSGFEDDPYYSCDERLLEGISPHKAPPELKTPEGGLKKYEKVRDYLYKTHPDNYGKPLYNNQAKNFMMMGPRSYGKALSPDTKVIRYPYYPTPIREIRVGDLVLARDGSPTSVTAVTPVMNNLVMYKIKLSDNSEVVACEDHKWVVKPYRASNEEKVVKTSELTTKMLIVIGEGLKYGRWEFKIPPLDLFILSFAYPKLLTYENRHHVRIVTGKEKEKVTKYQFAAKRVERTYKLYRNHIKFLENIDYNAFLSAPIEDRKKILEYIDSEEFRGFLSPTIKRFRRKLKWSLGHEYRYRRIKSIKKSSCKRGKCISVAHPSATYVLESGMATHNSYMMGSGIIAHEFLFDGRQEYDPEKFKKNPTSTNIYVGAGDAKYSNDLLSKTELTLDHLPGAVEVNGEYYPPPFHKKAVGSLLAGKKGYIAKYTVKVGNNWVERGTKTGIYNRTAKDNPYVFQGGRGTIALMEEVGMFANVRQVYDHTEDVLQDGPNNKFGVFGMIGTGGDMEKGTLDAYYMFYHPKEFNLVTYDDIWEHKGDIALFIPAEYGNNKFKNAFGFTQFKEAHEAEKRNRDIRKGSPSRLRSYIVYHPQVPSEVFMVSKGSLLPSVELKNRRAELQANESLYRLNEKVCELYFDSKKPTGVNYRIIVDGSKIPIREFPYRGEDREGALIIYEFPILDEDSKMPPNGLYIIGHDPYGDDSPDGPSMAAIYVMKTRLDKVKYGHNEIVAQYIGRPYNGRREVNELLLKLAMFYNAKVWFENNRGNVKEFFEKHKKLSLLAKHPVYTLSNKAAHAQMKGERNIYGFSISSRKDKLDGIHYLREWLLEERGVDDKGNIVRNLDLIPDAALIDEMTYYNFDGNFDRVSAFIGCVLGVEEQFNKYLENSKMFKKKEDAVEAFFANKLRIPDEEYFATSYSETIL